ncbi:hypothetical protein RIF29_15210 [Crotalaria pallida]|uniref:inorganic diphosphatase n=1 Tax=Crotalaria pallida TaxID=3830 RepID=A0AAN9IB02_CROPI
MVDVDFILHHDVDAGVLKKVILADGAVVTAKGARSVSLRHPLDLPLPLNRSQNGFAAGLLTLAEQLRHTSRTLGAPLLSLCIVGPTSKGEEERNGGAERKRGSSGNECETGVKQIGERQRKIGEVLGVKPLTALAMIDEGELDRKIVAILLNDPKASLVNDDGDW